MSQNLNSIMEKKMATTILEEEFSGMIQYNRGFFTKCTIVMENQMEKMENVMEATIYICVWMYIGLHKDYRSHNLNSSKGFL